ncbi:MAG TPA: M23 family metallopeptidase [Nocardioidaceae bacterium]|nr:M23 family metallopeptidase [Nocardioidaceae bacterium]
MTTTILHLAVLLLAVGLPAPIPPLPPPAAGALQQSPAEGVWPLDPQPAVVERFSPPLSPYGAGHRGVDLAGRAGQVVRAAAGGRVTFAGSLAGRGVVVVSHGATRTTYEPVRASVAVGTLVAAGDRLGTLQGFASHCAPAACLHWGLVEGETYLDPLTLVGAGPVRLLPLEGMAPDAPVSWAAPTGAARPV